MITLIVVNCQNDFISGTMLVKGAKEILTNIKDYISKNLDSIDKIIFTIEWHPFNHCSFKKNGGQQQVHCVQYTPGACIEPKLLKYVQSTNLEYCVSQIGTIEEVDDKGAFRDIEFAQDSLGKRYYFDSIVVANADTDFVICGLTDAVKETIKNMAFGNIIPKVFVDGININVKKLIEDYKLEVC